MLGSGCWPPPPARAGCACRDSSRGERTRTGSLRVPAVQTGPHERRTLEHDGNSQGAPARNGRARCCNSGLRSTVVPSIPVYWQPRSKLPRAGRADSAAHRQQQLWW
eukprot:549339-Prymnesium_polylepis.1